METLNAKIINCEKCPRLRKHCADIAVSKKREFESDTYWGKPVPNFNSSTKTSRLLIVGLAPAAHGANRTGRLFTGDRSGEWLYRALEEFGFYNDKKGALFDCSITNVCHCAPPENKPTKEEIYNCQPFLKQSFSQTFPNVVLALGKIAFDQSAKILRENGWWKDSKIKLKFEHGFNVLSDDKKSLFIASYHPSQQNTFTGVLTKPMFDGIFKKIKEHLK